MSTTRYLDIKSNAGHAHFIYDNLNKNKDIKRQMGAMKCKTLMSKKEIKKEWNELYANFPLEGLPWHSQRPAQALVGLINKKEINKGLCLDIGCGAATNSLYLASKGFAVIGLDISIQAIHLAKKKAEFPKSKTNFVVADAAILPFKDSSFDFIFDRGCFHHIPSLERKVFVEGLHRVLGENGKYLLICFSDKNPPRENTFSQSDIFDYFSSYFDIHWIRSSIFREFGRINRFFYFVFMSKLP